jgi:hypothetical protein
MIETVKEIQLHAYTKTQQPKFVQELCTPLKAFRLAQPAVTLFTKINIA